MTNTEELIREIRSHPWFERREAEYYRWYPMDLALPESPPDPSDIAPCGVEGVYIHVPFCDRICAFCPYNRQTDSDERIARYVEALRKEIRLYENELSRRPVEFIYFGGGTPSTLSPAQIAHIIDDLHGVAEVSRDCEVSLEAHPTHVVRSDFSEYRTVGVNRVSIGIQSLTDRTLTTIGATHRQADSYAALGRVSKLFDNWGIDLLYRCPGTDPAAVLRELEELEKICLPPHVSAYSLYLPDESNQPSRVQEIEMAVQIVDFFQRRGLSHYASCASGGYDFALDGFRGRYEHRHWTAPQASYLGLGCGAFGQSDAALWVNVHDPARYTDIIKKGLLPILAKATVDQDELVRRRFALGFKTLEIDLTALRGDVSCGIPPAIESTLDSLVELRLLQIDGGAVRLSDIGRHFVDQVTSAFWSDRQRQESHPETEDLRRLERSLPD